MTPQFILVLFLSTANVAQTGAAGVTVVFDDRASCVSAGAALSNDATSRGNFVLTWGCFAKGKQ